MPDPSPKPRRQQRHPRSAVRLAVRISTIDAETDPETGDPYFLSADEECHDLSRGGLFVMTHEPVPLGSRLLVELDLPGRPGVQAIGRVAWSRVAPEASSEAARPGIGIEFLGGARADLDAVERYVDGVSRRTTRRAAAPPPIGQRPTA